jgi:hypothetical protein
MKEGPREQTRAQIFLARPPDESPSGDFTEGFGRAPFTSK